MAILGAADDAGQLTAAASGRDDEDQGNVHAASVPGGAEVPAVRRGQWHQITSPLILQSGPAALTDGLDVLHRIVMNWSRAHA